MSGSCGPKLHCHPAVAFSCPNAPPLLRRPPSAPSHQAPVRCICNEGKPSRHLHLPCRMRLLLALHSLAVDTHRPRRFLFRLSLAGCAPGEIVDLWIRTMAR
ncbi:hypothetical protein PVAP13_5KG420270 [Panicum virgatum]|uniref:Uncharacterized protein n=1 Tax=Panicum virgatum TaxID=38727 RepID=A0A8T0SU84_PANVG|nr:hypothetical protein PVAP13_5KG420270 [Panicum virgatum]